MSYWKECWHSVCCSERAEGIIEGKGTLNELKVCSNEIAASTAQLVVSSQVKADKESKKLAGMIYQYTMSMYIYVYDYVCISMSMCS